MDFTEFLGVLWRRKLVAVLVLALTVALGVAVLFLQTPVYRATSTVSLLPASATSDADPIFVISQIDVITPLYAAAADTRATKVAAAERLDGALADVSVRTFRGAPILKIDAESTDPELARASADAVTDVLLERVEDGEVGIPEVLRLTQIDAPVAPTDPVRPQPRLVLAVAVLLGLGAGVGAAVGSDTLTRRIDSGESLAAATGLPVYGEIPSHRTVEKVRSPSELVGATDYREVAEVLRDIRTNLQFADARLRSVLVTSPEGRHGKTTVALGLAATMAKAGIRTVLVDGDLRRGRMATLLGLPSSPGLVDVLHGMPAAEAIMRTDLADLELLPSGPLQDDPLELLERSFFEVLYGLESRYDMVVVDATPLVPVNDARLMARYASASLLVVGSDRLSRRQVRTALERLEMIGVEARAAVLNQSRTRHKASYYRYLRPVEDKAAAREA